MTLKDLRLALHLSQEEVAKRAGMTQGEYSRLEHRDDHKLSTLTRVVQAMGGRLDLVAAFHSARWRGSRFLLRIGGDT